MDSLRGSPVNLGATRKKLARPPRKDDAREPRSASSVSYQGVEATLLGHSLALEVFGKQTTRELSKTLRILISTSE